MDWALFFSALLSATLLPGGSEALLLYRLQQGDDPLGLVLIAGTGNLLGSLLTYVMGRMANAAFHRRWLGIDERQLQRAEGLFRRWGRPSLLFAWLPVVGDPLCLLAGILGTGLPGFLLLVGVGKFARYTVVAWLGV